MESRRLIGPGMEGPVAVRMAVEQQGPNRQPGGERRTKSLEAKIIGCLEARTGTERGVVGVGNGRVWRVIPTSRLPWAAGADP
jgi:hypothetical protein